MSLRHTLLGILDWVPLHGYALREIAKGYAWLHPMSNTNIYPALRHLETEGFVSHREEIHEGRVRKVYQTTADGKAELSRWLSDRTPQNGVYRDPALLKICLLREGTLEGARPWIADELERARKAVAESDAVLKNSSMWPRFTALVAEHGRELVRERTRFFESLLQEIDAAEGTEPGAPTGSAPPNQRAAG